MRRRNNAVFCEVRERLKELEADGIVDRAMIPETPVRIRYRPTEKGYTLQGMVDAISDWASEWVAGSGDSC